MPGSATEILLVCLAQLVELPTICVMLFNMRYKANRRSWTDEQLTEAVVSSFSMGQTVEKLGLKATAAGNRNTVKKYIAQLALPTDHWHGQGWVGKRAGHPTRKPLVEYLVENSAYSTSYLGQRLRKEGLLPYECSVCGISEWRGEPISLELDHVNGQPRDHRIENVRFLCPNCHAQTPTWRGRKKKRVPLA